MPRPKRVQRIEWSTSYAGEEGAELEVVRAEEVGAEEPVKEPEDHEEVDLAVPEDKKQAELEKIEPETIVCSQHAEEDPGVIPNKEKQQPAPKFRGETKWSAFLVQFEAWLRLDVTQKKECCDLLGLALEVEGEAQMLYSSLLSEERSDYELMKMKL